jgi:hypothetical protein
VSRRRLAGVLILAAAWCATATAAAVAIGRAVRLADRRPTYVPQLDAPLWHGTDMPAPGGDLVLVHETRDEWPPPSPADGSLAGAILGLAYATDETTARYWLAVAARRGADWNLQRELLEAWQQLQADDVQHLNAHRPEDSQ